MAWCSGVISSDAPPQDRVVYKYIRAGLPFPFPLPMLSLPTHNFPASRVDSGKLFGFLFSFRFRVAKLG